MTEVSASPTVRAGAAASEEALATTMRRLLDLVGIDSPAEPRSWSENDTSLYALAVGAAMDDPLTELSLTTENSIGVVHQALPTMPVSIGAPLGPLESIDLTLVLAAGQEVRLTGPLPTTGRVDVRSHIASVHQLKDNALIRLESEARDSANGHAVYELVTTWFVRGGGRFADAPAVPDSWVAPDRAPDHVVTYRTRADQALLYRIVGHPNPIHSDPVFAARAGLDRPILQGPCVYGFAGRALVANVCSGDASRVRYITARFSNVVIPGQVLRVEIWDEPTDRTARFRVRLADGAIALDRGRLDYVGDADGACDD
jgi:acyl dehydratase